MLKVTHVLFPVALASFLTKDTNALFVTAFFGIISDFDLAVGIKHRGFTHSIPFVFLVAAAVYYVDRSMLIYSLIGLTSHLFLDMLTKSGVQLFYPIRRRYRLLTFRYDNFFLNAFLILFSLYVLKKNGVVSWKLL